MKKMKDLQVSMSALKGLQIPVDVLKGHLASRNEESNTRVSKSRLKVFLVYAVELRVLRFSIDELKTLWTS